MENYNKTKYDIDQVMINKKRGHVNIFAIVKIYYMTLERVTYYDTLGHAYKEEDIEPYMPEPK